MQNSDFVLEPFFDQATELQSNFIFRYISWIFQIIS